MSLDDDSVLGQISPDDTKQLKQFYNDTVMLLDSYRDLQEDLKDRWQYVGQDIDLPYDVDDRHRKRLMKLKERIVRKLIEPYRNLNIDDVDMEPMETMETFTEIMEYVEDRYIDSADEVALEKILGMAQELVPYIGDYWNREEATAEDIINEHKTVGTDIELKTYTRERYNDEKQLSHDEHNKLRALGKILEIALLGMQPRNATGDCIGRFYGFSATESEGAFDTHEIGMGHIEHIKIHKNGKIKLRFQDKAIAEWIAEILTGETELTETAWKGGGGGGL